MNIKDVENATKTAMKSGEKDRVNYLRNLTNQIKLIAKNDKNRETTDEDVIAAANRIVKQNRETISFYPDGSELSQPLLDEITTVQEFLPKQMDREELSEMIDKLIAEGLASDKPKAARGHVMRVLNTEYRGMFDSKDVNELIGDRI